MKSSGILISVIIPAYNYGAVVERALDSVLPQLVDDIELLVVNDGSSDNTAEVLDDYARRHPGLVQVVHQANAGPAAARNRGIRLAKGDFALLLDADDELMPDALESLRRAVQSNPGAGMILGGQVSVYPDGRERRRLPNPVAGSPPSLVRRYLLDKRISIAHGCSLFRRDLLLQRPYPESLRGGEDIAVFVFLLVSAPVAVVRTSLAKIHKHADSLRHSQHMDRDFVARMVSEVFTSLPASCQPLRGRYEARRYLSLFRGVGGSGDAGLAWSCYKQAFRLHPREALRRENLARLFKYWVSGLVK